MKFNFRKKSFEIIGISEDDYIINIIKSTKSFYEKYLLEYMLLIFNNTESKNSLSIDVGANIGNHSIFFQKFLTEYLISVEPNPKILPILIQNLQKNISNYNIIDSAVSDFEGSASIVLPENATNNAGMAKVVLGENNNIKVTTIDNIVSTWQKNFSKPFNLKLIKIDVEGMELSVLKGAIKTINKYKPHIFVEATSSNEGKHLNDFLSNLGYKNMYFFTTASVNHFAYNPSICMLIKIYFAIFVYKIRKCSDRFEIAFKKKC